MVSKELVRVGERREETYGKTWEGLCLSRSGTGWVKLIEMNANRN